MSLFARLFLLLALVSSLSLGTVAALLWRNSRTLEAQLQRQNAEAGQRVRQNGANLMEDSLENTHLIIVGEKARRVQSYFFNIADAVQLEATLVRQFLSDKDTVVSAPPLFEANQLTHKAQGDPAVKRNMVGTLPYSIYHLAPGTRPRQTKDATNRLRRLGAFFAYTYHNVPGCDSAYFGSSLGFIQGYPGGKTFFKPSYDPRKRPWYTAAVNIEPSGAINWLVDKDRDGKTLFLTCSRTVTLPGQKKPIGVVAIDVQWPDVVEELFNVGQLSVNKAILVDNDGLVRVSALYDTASRGSKPEFDRRDALSTPLVASTPGFASVVTHIRNNPLAPSGVYWEGKERGKKMWDVSDVFLYATVNLTQTGSIVDKKTATHDSWYYIVRVPTKNVRATKAERESGKPLLQPISDMTQDMQASTNAMSGDIRESTRELVAIILKAIAATLLVALGVAYFGARATSRPLIHMAQVARGVGEGNLDQEAVETSGGEIGEMGRAINAMIRGLRQRNLLQETFSRYTAPSVVEEVLRRGGVQLGGVKSNATIFFSDLVGFTALSERTEPELLVTLLNEYFDAMTKVILGSEGTLDKYIGDAILAFWGHPIAHPDDAVRACRAALAQREQLRILCDKWEAQGYPRLDMRIGIETGEVIVGDVGSELKLNYTVLGDTVNLASRLESLNKTYGTRILIGETTRRLAGDAIEVRQIDLLAVAGKSRPVHVYELLGLTGTTGTEQLSAYAAYDRALHAYHGRRWDEAEAHLMRVLRELGPDKPCEVLLERIGAFRSNPPAPEWDGSSVLLHK